MSAEYEARIAALEERLRAFEGRLAPVERASAGDLAERYGLLAAWVLLILVLGYFKPDQMFAWNSYASMFGSTAMIVVLTLGLIVPLTAGELTDGPWRPDAANANRWDADLLRIRKVGVTLRVEAALGALRGPAGVLFSNGGSSRSANRWAPDQEIRFQVSPRNMNLARE